MPKKRLDATQHMNIKISEIRKRTFIYILYIYKKKKNIFRLIFVFDI